MAAFIRTSLQSPPQWDPQYVSHDRAAQDVAEGLTQFLKQKRSRTRIALLEEDGFDHQALPEWQPEEISGKLCTAVSKAGLKNVSFTASKETTVKTVNFLKKFNSAMYADSFLAKLGQAQQPDLRLTCKVLRVSASGEKAQLECSLLDLTSQVHLAPMTREFTHPDHVKKVREAQAEYSSAQSTLKSVTMAAGAGGAAGGMISLCLWGYFVRKRKQCYEQLPSLVGQLEQLIKQHSYHTAQDQIGRYLEFLPEDATLISLKDRLAAVLSDYGGDPFLAERAALKVGEFTAEVEAGRLPDPDAVQELEVLPGAPAKKLAARIKARIAEVKQLEYEQTKDAKQAEETRRTLDWLEGLVVQGKPRTALNEAQSKGRTLKAKELIDFMGAVESKIQAADKRWGEVCAKLSHADTAGAKSILDELLLEDGEHEQGVKLRAAMAIQPQSPPRRLKPQKVGKPVLLMHQEVFIVGRDPSKGASVVVDDDRVSRAHLKLCILEDQLRADDLESQNGSFLGQDKFKQVIVGNGDIIKLAKAVAIEVHISYEGVVVDESAETRLAGPAEASAPGRAGQQKRGKVQGVLLDFPKFFVLWGKAPVSISAAGMQPNRASRTMLCYKDGILLFGRDGDLRPVFAGEIIAEKGVTYQLSA